MDINIFNEFWNKDQENYKSLVSILESIIPHIEPYDNDDSGMQITISVNKDCTTWSYQSGDNSYTGSCYGDPYWGVNYLDKDTNAYDAADYLIQDLSEQIQFNS